MKNVKKKDFMIGMSNMNKVIPKINIVAEDATVAVSMTIAITDLVTENVAVSISLDGVKNKKVVNRLPSLHNSNCRKLLLCDFFRQNIKFISQTILNFKQTSNGDL